MVWTFFLSFLLLWLQQISIASAGLGGASLDWCGVDGMEGEVAFGDAAGGHQTSKPNI